MLNYSISHIWYSVPIADSTHDGRPFPLQKLSVHAHDQLKDEVATYDS